MMLQLGDPVFVERHYSNPTTESPSSRNSASRPTTLEGVVAYIGDVEFARGEDWVGVRLTGDSNGKGKNDGSVQGVRYFVCEPKCGVFVRRAAVTKRELNRLEELRLRRELGAAMLASAPAAPTPAESSKDSSSWPTSSTSSGGSRNNKKNTSSPRRHEQQTPIRRQTSLQKALSASKVQGTSSSVRSTPQSQSRPGTCKSPRRPNGKSLPSKTKSKPTAQHLSSSAERDRGSSAVSTPVLARRSRLDQIRERKAALAAAQDNQSDELTSPPRNARSWGTSGATSATALVSSHGEVNSPPSGVVSTVVTKEKDANTLKEELSSLRGQMIALQDENGSLRRTLAVREREVREAQTQRQSENNVNEETRALKRTGAPPTANCISDTSRNGGDSFCADSPDEVLQGGRKDPAANGPQDASMSLAPSHGDTHESDYADLVEGIKTPAKPDLERRLAKALLKIALLQEEIDELGEKDGACTGQLSRALGFERVSEGEEHVLIRVPLTQVRQSDLKCVPGSLPFSMQGIIPSAEWPNFADEANDIIMQWATATTLPCKSVLIGLCMSLSLPLPLLLYSQYVAAIMSLSGVAIVALMMSYRDRKAHSARRSELETLLNDYKERWPGASLELSKHRDSIWGCWRPTHLYNIRVASSFDVEEGPPCIRRCTDATSRLLETDDMAGNVDLEEPLLSTDGQK